MCYIGQSGCAAEQPLIIRRRIYLSYGPMARNSRNRCHTPKPDLFRGRVAPRADHVLRDRLRTGGAPWLPHLYRPDAVAGLDLAGGSDERSALFITHAHPDHMGLIGWVDREIPIYGSPETQRIVVTSQLIWRENGVGNLKLRVAACASYEVMGYPFVKTPRYAVRGGQHSTLRAGRRVQSRLPP